MLTTAVFILCVTLMIVGLDVVWATDSIDGNTVSRVLRNWGLTLPVVPYIWGVLSGHFWGGFEILDQSSVWELKVTIWTMWVALLPSFYFHSNNIELPWWGAWLVLNLGFFIGSLTWTQVN